MKFYLPDELNAKMPPERRGIRRDHVRLLVLHKDTGTIDHTNFSLLDQYLNKGDLIVVNSSRTVPAVLKGIREGENREIEVRLAHRKNNNIWEALIVGEELKTGESIRFSSQLTASVVQSDPHKPFVTLQFNLCCSALYNQIYRIGEPVRYEYINEPWGLDYYQTVFGINPGSVEMPSAGRAFSWELLFRLQRKGINITHLQLHTGLSYLMDDKWNLGPRENYEEYEISQETVDAIIRTKAEGGKVIAVGTTVVRALETAINKFGKVEANKGWTNLYISSSTKLQVVDGLITGLHEPEASHLDLLTAFVDQNLLYNTYQEAIELKYLWHEFGDMNLIL
ncbi:S-adenosylmethionine:tRNA ribosyltransferase-isomerase [Heyndrickxia sp. NPDC080065]|uniref:S-adenosylmethionine:tRNA ribosyltransferase-isomerase n=1 Tax=Heyndrickxia sp. NPDC080065 TaxID=3390568 RepID=UPI003CFEF03B